MKKKDDDIEEEEEKKEEIVQEKPIKVKKEKKSPEEILAFHRQKLFEALDKKGPWRMDKHGILSPKKFLML